jgi:hypothetical protein
LEKGLNVGFRQHVDSCPSVIETASLQSPLQVNEQQMHHVTEGRHQRDQYARCRDADENDIIAGHAAGRYSLNVTNRDIDLAKAISISMG